MSRNLSFVVLLFFTFSGILFLEGFGSFPVDTKAKSIVDSMCAQAKHYSTITAHVMMTSIDPKGDTLWIRNDNLQLKQNKIALSIHFSLKDSSQDYEYYFNGKEAYLYFLQKNEAVLDTTISYKYDSISRRPEQSYKIFTGFCNTYKPSFAGEKVINGRTYVLVNLYPDEPRIRSFNSVKLIIDKETNQLSHCEFLGKNGSKVVYDVLDMTPNLEIDDNAFEFDPLSHPGVKVRR